MATKKKGKRRVSPRKKEQRVWVPGVEQFGRVTHVEASGQVHVECDNGFRWFGDPKAIISEADTVVEQETAPAVQETSPEPQGVDGQSVQ